MSWRAVGVVYAVFALLVAVVLLSETRTHDTGGPPTETAPERSLLGVEPSAVRAVLFRRGDAQVRAERADGRWRILEPRDAAVPSDLVEAVVATLTAGQVSEIVGDAGTVDLGAFGLTSPTSTIVLSAGGDHDVTVLFGERNPTRTAVYARLADDPRVYLVGLNVRYYEDLIFEAAATRG